MCVRIQKYGEIIDEAEFRATMLLPFIVIYALLRNVIFAVFLDLRLCM